MNKRNLLKAAAAVTLALAGTALHLQAQAQTALRIGFFPGPYADQFKRGVLPILEKAGVKVQLTEFSNAIQPNSALMDGSLDANVFQNRAFMEVFNTQNKGDLTEVLRVPSAPLGLYSKKFRTVASVTPGATVALPNDPTSMGRSLAFLQSQGLLTVDPAAPFGRATEKNVTANPKNLKLVLLDAPQIPRAMAEMDLSVALGNHIIASGMLLSDAIALEDPAPQYQIILVARQGAVNSPALQQLVSAYKSADYRRFIESDPKSKGFSKPDHWR
ncbi:MAG: MetQ/NlpA family ABC transporter substrate-binding protein [Pseudomonadota bacterium]